MLRREGDAPHGPEAQVPEGTMRAFEIAPALRGHVSYIAAYRERIPDGQQVLERVLPDGAVHLIFNLGDAPSAGGGAGFSVEAAGASAAPVVLTLRGRLEGVSLALRPGAAAALLGLPASEITDAAVPLDALWRGEGERLLERMAQAPDDAARVALLQAALLQRLQRSRIEAHRGVMQAVQLIAASGGQRPLREVAAAVGVGERRLQQLFQAHVGLSPRAFGRLARLHACLRALRQPTPGAWAAVAVDAGFYDQSHLINEFQALCGLSPRAFLERVVSVSSKTSG